MRHRSLVLALALVASACGAPAPAEDTGNAAAPINGGNLVITNEAPFNSVVRYTFGIGGACTATKIGARRFLTAAHCFTLGLAVGNAVNLTNAIDGISGVVHTTVASLDSHPTFTNNPLGADLSRAYDIGILTIAADTPTIPTLPVQSEYVDAGSAGFTVGYGCDQTPDGVGHAGKKQLGAFSSMSLAQFEQSSGSTFEVAYDLDTYNTIFDGFGTRSLCGSDTGGPQLFLSPSGQFQVGAVSSRSPDFELSFQARVGNVKRWIDAPGVNAIFHGSGGSFINGKSDLCVGVDGGSTANDASAGQYYCDGRSQTVGNQFWILFSSSLDNTFHIRNGKSGKCLGIDGGSTANGARIAQYTCGTSGVIDDQAWRFTAQSSGKLAVVNAKSNRCIGVDGASMNRETTLAQFACDGALNQGWIFSR